MSRTIAILMKEHRLIERVLGSLETFLDQLSADERNRADLKNFAEFFREFADRCHHGKEEDRLFVSMTDYGFSKFL
jgi:hemerythrin-like domain-containing protein